MIASMCTLNAQSKTKRAVFIEVVPNGKIFLINESDPAYKIDSARFAFFIPNGIDEIKGVFIHQHGCTMEGRGISSAFDLQYQAFAKKWKLAIVGPDFYDAENNCHDWKNPENGTADALLKALKTISEISMHKELFEAPWLLWGHSGGGYWAQAMMKDFPERVMGVFSYSPGLDARFNYPEVALQIPLMIRHAGAEGDACCVMTALNTFNQLRSRNAYVGISYTPFQNHNFSFVRYLAIPFFESVLSQRLPQGKDISFKNLRPMNIGKAWLGDTSSLNLFPEKLFAGTKQSAAWLPDSLVAHKWREYSITGTVVDRSAPPAPYDLSVFRRHNVTVELSWKADADIESGISHFNIYRGTQLIGRYPAFGSYQSFDTNGDDAYPLRPAPMKMDVTLLWNDNATLSVSSVNHFGLESERTEKAP